MYAYCILIPHQRSFSTIMDDISSSELAPILNLEVLDKHGARHSLQSLVQGKRVVVIFVRWFGEPSGFFV